MSWSDVEAEAGVWGSGSTGAAVSWTDDTASDTTARNTSRFILLNPSAGSIRGVVDFAIHVRSVDAGGRGAAALVTAIDPVLIHSSGDSTV